MKRIILFLAAATFLASCQKTYVCDCTDDKGNEYTLTVKGRNTWDADAKCFNANTEGTCFYFE